MSRRMAGSRWRILVHDMPAKRGDMYGTAHHVAHDRRFGGGTGEDTNWSRHVEIPGTEFDELVVGEWIHVEQMDHGFWWMDIGGVILCVRANHYGKPTSVSVYGPGDYTDPVAGVTYSLTWTAGGEQ